jgi:hypothetical protein
MGADMSKATAVEEMYLIYQVVRNYLTDSEPWEVLGGRPGGFVPLLLLADILVGIQNLKLARIKTTVF